MSNVLIAISAKELVTLKAVKTHIHFITKMFIGAPLHISPITENIRRNKLPKEISAKIVFIIFLRF
jgi:hypothetical protein